MDKNKHLKFVEYAHQEEDDEQRKILKFPWISQKEELLPSKNHRLIWTSQEIPSFLVRGGWLEGYGSGMIRCLKISLPSRGWLRTKHSAWNCEWHEKTKHTQVHLSIGVEYCYCLDSTTMQRADGLMIMKSSVMNEYRKWKFDSEHYGTLDCD